MQSFSLITKHGLLLLLALLPCVACFGQKQLALSFDDAPNTLPSMQQAGQPRLLELLDSLQLPATIFINEGKLKKEDSLARQALLEAWVRHPHIGLGNHTNDHGRYSSTKPEAYWQNIQEGERLSRPLAAKYNKALTQFRFPFNDLGDDSLQQHSIQKQLARAGYQITPFTLESADWMFNALYIHYLNSEQPKEAARIGQSFVGYTLALLQHFDSLSQTVYARPIRQIYLGHDNLLHVHYLPALVAGFRDAGYEIVPLEKALTDPVYQQENTYYKKWGISWLYRWMIDAAERRRWMLAEPSLEAISAEFERQNLTTN